MRKSAQGVNGAIVALPDWIERIARLTQPHDPHASADLAVGDVGNMPHVAPPALDQIVDQVLHWRESLQGFPPSET